MRTRHILASLLSCCLALAATPAIAADPAGREPLGWNITSTVVVEGGLPTRTSQGWIVHDYSVRGVAVATAAGNPIPRGRFAFRGTIFSPEQDMAGEKAGRWYLQGRWSITSDRADPASPEVKHTPPVFEGELRADLPFNPSQRTAAPIEARLLVPRSPAPGRRTSGNGAFAGNGRLEGSIQIEVERRPAAGG
jgi:hypothetical protein